MARKIKMNAYGNWVGYEGRCRVAEFGIDMNEAFYWLRTGVHNWDMAYERDQVEETRCQFAKIGNKKCSAYISEKDFI